MAADIALLEAAEAGQPGGRIYSWDDVWVTLGRAQKPDDVLLAPEATKWIIRPTGGGAVLHGHDLAVGMAVPMQRSVRDSYRIITQPLLRAFNAAGIPAILAEEQGDGDPRRRDCFAGSSANDIIDRQTRRKICGCALRRSRSAVLLQASIPLNLPVVRPEQIIRGGVPVVPVELDVDAFVEALTEAEYLRTVH